MNFNSIMDFNKDGKVSGSEKTIFLVMLIALFVAIWKGKKKAKKAYGAGIRRARSMRSRVSSYRSRASKYFRRR